MCLVDTTELILRSSCSKFLWEKVNAVVLYQSKTWYCRYCTVGLLSAWKRYTLCWGPLFSIQSTLCLITKTLFNWHLCVTIWNAINSHRLYRRTVLPIREINFPLSLIDIRQTWNLNHGHIQWCYSHYATATRQKV